MDEKPDRPAKIEGDYADRRKIQLTNSGRTRSMANGGNGLTKQDLLDEIDALQQVNQDLQDQALDAIADIVSPPKNPKKKTKTTMTTRTDVSRRRVYVHRGQLASAAMVGRGSGSE
jgi:hypothetical protein